MLTHLEGKHWKSNGGSWSRLRKETVYLLLIASQDCHCLPVQNHHLISIKYFRGFNMKSIPHIHKSQSQFTNHSCSIHMCAVFSVSSDESSKHWPCSVQHMVTPLYSIFNSPAFFSISVVTPQQFETFSSLLPNTTPAQILLQ